MIYQEWWHGLDNVIDTKVSDEPRSARPIFNVSGDARLRLEGVCHGMVVVMMVAAAAEIAISPRHSFFFGLATLTLAPRQLC